MDIAEVVRAQIAASGKPESEIARDAELPQPTVNRIANGKLTNLTTATLQKLCKGVPGLNDAIADGLRRAS
jgi:DNA-binding Xre family transcriptional regulator